MSKDDEKNPYLTEVRLMVIVEALKVCLKNHQISMIELVCALAHIINEPVNTKK